MSRIMRFTPFLLLLFSTSPWAQGFYVGAGLGPEFTDFKQTSSVLIPGNANVKDTTHVSGSGVFGSLFAGYSWVKNRYYLAGEVNADISSVEFTSSNQEFIHSSFSNTNYKLPHSLGLSVLPGYLLTESTILYARLGYTYGNFKISTSDTSSVKINRNLSGIRYGLGVNQSLSQHFAARMEYSQVSYKSTTFTAVAPPATKTTKITPLSNKVEFSLIYNFS